MKKIKTEKLKFTAVELLLVVAVAVSMLLCGYCTAKYDGMDANFNIGDTTVDFIIPSPSKEQVTELRGLEHVLSAVPYYYTSQTVEGDKICVNTNLYIIDRAEELGNTVFSEKLLVKKGEGEPEAPLYVSDVFADNLGVTVGESLRITVFGAEIEFTVAAVYKDDNRAVGGTLFAVLKGELAEAAPENYRYTGAFVSSSNYGKTEEYLENYKPLGDLRPRSDFSSDESYQAYLKSREETDYTNSIFYKAEYVESCKARYGTRLQSNVITRAAICVAAAIVTFAVTFGRATVYCNRDARRDIRNNFTASDVSSMLGGYFAGASAAVLIVCLISAVLEMLIWGVEIVSAVNIIFAAGMIFACLIASAVAVSAFKKKFARSI